MIDCPNAEVRDLLPDFAHDRERLAVDERIAVESHLATCPACREELALLHAVRRAYSRAPAVDVERVVAALPRPGARSVAPPTRRVRRSWQHAAALAVFAVGASALWLALGDPTDRPTPVDVDSTVASAAPQTAAPTMPLGQELSELSDEDLESLLGALDDLEALPALDPAPMIEPLGGEDGL